MKIHKNNLPDNLFHPVDENDIIDGLNLLPHGFEIDISFDSRRSKVIFCSFLRNNVFYVIVRAVSNKEFWQKFLINNIFPVIRERISEKFFVKFFKDEDGDTIINFFSDEELLLESVERKIK